MKKVLTRILPIYGILPVLFSLFSNFFVYYGARLCNTGRVHHAITLPFLDTHIPFQSWAITIYVFAYVFWVIGFIVIARDGREICYETLSGELVAKLLCLLIFLLFPTVMKDRPVDFPVRNAFDWLTKLIYSLDPPDNLFPSMHCMESWIVLRGAFRCKHLRRPVFWRSFSVATALAIFASTLLVKQHVFLDVLGGVAVAELGLLLARRFRTGRLYARLERRPKDPDLIQ